MRTLTALMLALTTGLLAGCATDSARAYKMHQTSGKMTRGSDVGYRAICNTLVTGSHADIWTGTMWSEKERAMRDALQHNKEFPGHNAKVDR
ncbi:MAG: hypothetical protein IH623_01570 [Verrucomicrobia bacterium]|nr:hypothetical protein [Verrucomicrobiota bacterium]